MTWSAAESRWHETYESASAYYRGHGDLNVPRGFKAENGTELYGWIRSQRLKRRNGTLAPRCVAMLDEIGMVWSA